MYLIYKGKYLKTLIILSVLLLNDLANTLIILIVKIIIF